MRHPLPNVPFVEAYHKAGRHTPRIIELRLSDTSAATGSALKLATYWNRTNAPKDTSHYVIDEMSTYRCTPDNIQAGHWQVSQNGVVSVTLCAFPVEHEDMWLTGYYRLLLKDSAILVAQLCLAHKISPKLVSYEKMSRGGIFKPSGIYVAIPGAWPTEEFLKLVKAQIAERKSR